MKHYHFIGIGGIGMSALASILLDKGYRVSGSDVKDNDQTQMLKKKGAKIYLDHSDDNLKGATTVVYTGAIRATNPEMIGAVSRQIPLIKRAQLLAELLNEQIGITVAGAHGKTTTTSMVSNMLIHAGLDPTTAVGGVVNGSNVNASLGTGKYFVAEADESDGTFLYFAPHYSIITNIDFEHIDYYKNWDNIISAFKKFIRRTHPNGEVIICAEDHRLKQLVLDESLAVTTYGFDSSFDVYAQNIVNDGYLSSFDCFAVGQKLGRVDLIVPGRHNVLNALATIALGLKLGLSFSTISASLQVFYGVKRRFQLKGNFDDVMVVDDYGHHPTEILATLNAAKSFRRQRLVVVFQPHRYSRTKFLMDEFVQSLVLCDYLILTDVYAASEKPSEGADVTELYSKIKKQFSSQAIYLKKEKIVDHLMDVVKPGDLVLTLGAGDVTLISDQFTQAWHHQHSSGKMQ